MTDGLKLDMASPQSGDIPPGARLDIRELLESGARMAGSRVIFSDRKRTVTGSELQLRVSAIATCLPKTTATPGPQIVVIDVDDTIDAIGCYWAALHAGLTPMLASPELAASKLAELVPPELMSCVITRHRKLDFESLGARSYSQEEFENLVSTVGTATMPPARQYEDHDLCSLVLATRADGQTELVARSHRSVALTGLIGQLIIGPGGEERIGICGPVSSTLFEWVLHCAVMARNPVVLLDEEDTFDQPRGWDWLLCSTSEDGKSAPCRTEWVEASVRRVVYLDSRVAEPFRDGLGCDTAVLGKDGHGFIGTCHSSDQPPHWFLAPLVKSAIPCVGATRPDELLDKRPFSAQSGIAVEDLRSADLDFRGQSLPADVCTLLRASAIQRQHDPALMQSDVVITYGELLDRAARLASLLKNKFNVGAGERVALLALNRIEFFEIYLATVQIGAVFVPLNFRLSESEIRIILADCRPQLMIAEFELIRRLGNETKEFSWGGQLLYLSDVPKDPGSEYERQIASADPIVEDAALADQQISSILYTAGTTGLPKGVARSHKAVLWFGFIFCPTSLRQVAAAAHLCSPPLFHIAGHETAALPALAMGRRVVVQRQFDAKKLLAAIARFKITSAFLPPSMAIEIGAMLGSCTEDISSLRDISSGSAPISVAARDMLCLHLPSLRFKNSLGMTEVGGIACLQGERLFAKDSTCVGSPGPGVDVRIVGADDQPLEQGQTGEIQIRSPQLFSAYWSNPDGTRSAFAGGWFHTGDLGLVDDDGDLHIVGRIKDMIVTGGENVYAAEVERALLGIEGVAEAAVMGVPDAKWGESVLACIVRASESVITETEVIAQCRQKIAHYKCPRYCIFVDAFPRSAVGKVQKQVLRQHWEQIDLVSS